MSEYGKLFNIDVEVDVISACLSNTDLYLTLKDRLQPKLFTDYETRKAIALIHQVSEEVKVLDISTMATYFTKEAINISRFISINHFSYEVTKDKVALLEDLSIRRRFFDVCYKGETISSDPMVDVTQLQAIVKELDSVINDTNEENVLQFGAVSGSLMNKVANRMNGKEEKGMLTGLHIFDSRWGFHGGDLVIIAGETSQGKSTLATTIAYNMACSGIAVAYYSLEMSAEQLTARIMAVRTKVSSSRMLYDKLNDQEYQQVYDSTLALKGLPIYFDEQSKTSFQRICMSVKKLVKLHNVRVVFIDYLQILANGRADNREQVIGDMARDLKRLAVDTNTCIVALSQMARAANGVKEPSISRMRGSGQIEEACDMAILIYRPDPSKQETKLYIAKGRNIGLAKEKVKFNTELSYFSDYEQGDPQAPYQEQTSPLPF